MSPEFEIKGVADVIKIADETEKLLEALYNNGTNFPQGIWFRGQQDKSWKLVPRVFRRNCQKQLIYDEFNTFKHIKLIKPEYRDNYKTTFEWLCLLQHFGLPTRLLDWSESILVALYFAVSDTEEKTKDKDAKLFALSSYKLNCFVNQPRKGSIYLPDDEEVIARAENVNVSDIDRLFELITYEYKNGEIIVGKLNEHVKNYQNNNDEMLWKALSYPVAVYPYRLNNRMVFQQSVFTINGGTYVPESPNPIPEPSILDDLNAKLSEENRFLKSFVIPQKYKSKIKDELNRIGIHKGALFPELEYQTSYINEKYMKKITPNPTTGQDYKLPNP